MKEKEWNIRRFSDEAAKSISAELDISKLAASILCARGIDTPQAASEFLCADTDKLCDPFLMKGMADAVREISYAVENGLCIAVYGDYDVDGMTSVSILIDYLSSLGANCIYYIPDRLNEGYGLNVDAIKNLMEKNVSLIITVDSGITAIEEIKYAQSLGMKVVLTDHHECAGEIPKADAVIDPKLTDCTYPFKSLAGVGVAFKLICALAGADKTEEMLSRYGDLVAVGTIADVMPLVWENRIIVKHGLELMGETKNIGLKALMKQAGLSADSLQANSISYVLAPRINAAGRMGCSEKAVELFLAKSEEEAENLAVFLCEKNRERQNTESVIFKDIQERLKNEFDPKKDKIIVMWGDDWHNGVIGIVASRVAEQYSVPTILISMYGDEGKGSGRSARDFNLYNAVESNSGFLTRSGGHALAVGISIERDKLEAFKAAMQEYAAEHFDDNDYVATVNIDKILEAKDITIDTVKNIRQLEPFGMDNEVPVFALYDVEIQEITPVKNDKCMRIVFKKDGLLFCTMAYGMPLMLCPVIEGERADIAFTMGLSRYKYKESVQMLLRDIRRAGGATEREKRDMAIYDKFVCGNKLTGSEAEELIPIRQEFVNIFRFIKSNASEGMIHADTDVLYRRIKRENRVDMSISRMRICLDVFNEFNIFNIRVDSDGGIYIQIGENVGKVDINGSKILAAVKNSIG